MPELGDGALPSVLRAARWAIVDVERASEVGEVPAERIRELSELLSRLSVMTAALAESQGR